MTKSLTNTTLALAIVLAIAVIYLLSASTQRVGASTVVGNDYTSTTTAVNANSYGNTITGSALIQNGSGSFGSVIITGAATGILNFYDATTSDITQRSSLQATSTILIASIPASLVAGVYTFDVGLSRGLYMTLVSGNMPTSTITTRR